MSNLADMTDDEVKALRDACSKELRRRTTLCRYCGGETKYYHVHFCSEDGGSNIPVDQLKQIKPEWA